MNWVEDRRADSTVFKRPSIANLQVFRKSIPRVIE